MSPLFGTEKSYFPEYAYPLTEPYLAKEADADFFAVSMMFDPEETRRHAIRCMLALLHSSKSEDFDRALELLEGGTMNKHLKAKEEYYFLALAHFKKHSYARSDFYIDKAAEKGASDIPESLLLKKRLNKMLTVVSTGRDLIPVFNSDMVEASVKNCPLTITTRPDPKRIFDRASALVHSKESKHVEKGINFLEGAFVQGILLKCQIYYLLAVAYFNKGDLARSESVYNLALDYKRGTDIEPELLWFRKVLDRETRKGKVLKWGGIVAGVVISGITGAVYYLKTLVQEDT